MLVCEKLCSLFFPDVQIMVSGSNLVLQYRIVKKHQPFFSGLEL